MDDRWSRPRSFLVPIDQVIQARYYQVLPRASVTLGSCLSCVWGYVAKQGPHAQSKGVMPCDRSTACSFRSLTSNADGQMHECVPWPAGSGHIRFCPGHHFLARMPKLRVNWKVNLPPKD